MLYFRTGLICAVLILSQPVLAEPGSDPKVQVPTPEQVAHKVSTDGKVVNSAFGNSQQLGAMMASPNSVNTEQAGQQATALGQSSNLNNLRIWKDYEDGLLTKKQRDDQLEAARIAALAGMISGMNGVTRPEGPQNNAGATATGSTTNTGDTASTNSITPPSQTSEPGLQSFLAQTPRTSSLPAIPSTAKDPSLASGSEQLADLSKTGTSGTIISVTGPGNLSSSPGGKAIQFDESQPSATAGRTPQVTASLGLAGVPANSNSSPSNPQPQPGMAALFAQKLLGAPKKGTPGASAQTRSPGSQSKDGNPLANASAVPRVQTNSSRAEGTSFLGALSNSASTSSVAKALNTAWNAAAGFERQFIEQKQTSENYLQIIIFLAPFAAGLILLQLWRKRNHSKKMKRERT